MRVHDSNEPSQRSIYTSQRFTRLNIYSTQRNLKTSQAPRAYPYNIKNKSLGNGKQNIGFASYMKKVESASKIDEKAEISKYLWSLRKQYDKLAKNTNQTKFKIGKMQKQIQRMRSVTQTQSKQLEQTHISVDCRQDQLLELTQKQEQSKIDKKILLNVIQRMKSDALVRKRCLQNQQRIIKEKKNQLKNVQETSIQWDESIHKMTEKLAKFKRQLQSQDSQRRLKLTEYENKLSDLKDKQNFELERKSRTYQLLNMESNDILDAKNVMLRDVFFTNKLLSSILENKINQVLKSNQEYQESYHRIKNQTNIEDPKKLCSKFMSYSETLKQITEKINLYESKLQNTIAKNKELIRIQKQRKIKKLQQEKNWNLKNQDMSSQKDKLRLELIQKQLSIKKIKEWAHKNLNSLKIQGNTQNFPLVFQKFCQQFLQQVKEIGQSNILNIKYETPSLRMRKILKQIPFQEQKQRKNQLIEVTQSNALEAGYIQKQRKQVKKNRFLIKSQTSKQRKQ